MATTNYFITIIYVLIAEPTFTTLMDFNDIKNPIFNRWIIGVNDNILNHYLTIVRGI
jgi:hypothetical protein